MAYLVAPGCRPNSFSIVSSIVQDRKKHPWSRDTTKSAGGSIRETMSRVVSKLQETGDRRNVLGPRSTWLALWYLTEIKDEMQLNILKLVHTYPDFAGHMSHVSAAVIPRQPHYFFTSCLCNPRYAVASAVENSGVICYWYHLVPSGCPVIKSPGVH